jgi:hypothetical protein
MGGNGTFRVTYAEGRGADRRIYRNETVNYLHFN